MFDRLFGRGRSAEAMEAADAAFAEAKQAGLERALGPMDEMVRHAIIPFFMGGGLDLYTFSACIPGTVVATQELIGRSRRDRPKRGRIGFFELVACLRPGVDPADDEAIGLVNRMLNPIARYAFMATLNPNETAEVPVGDDEPNLPVMLAEFEGLAPFTVKGERFGLLLCVPLLPAEFAFARREGTATLAERMRAAGAWPYADLGRGAVV